MREIGPSTKYHEKKLAWENFDIDLKEYRSDFHKYKGIFPREENQSWHYREGRKQIKTCKRLEDIYKFKLEYEAEREI